MTTELLKRKIKTTHDLRDIVSNMKMLSSVSILQYEQANRSLEKYRQNLRDAFHVLALHNGIPFMRKSKNNLTDCLFVLIGSDNGMVGRFNKEIITKTKEFAKKNHISLSRAHFITVGRRLGQIAESHQIKPEIGFAAGNSVKSVVSTAENIILKIDEIANRETVQNVFICYHRRRGSINVETKLDSILPFDVEHLHSLQHKKWDTNNFPFLAVDAAKMFSALLNETLMIQIAQNINYSLAAEHFTRMTNMQNAEQNIDENLEEMNLLYQQQRQEEITSELIDVVSGAEAIKK